MQKEKQEKTICRTLPGFVEGTNADTGLRRFSVVSFARTGGGGGIRKSWKKLREGKSNSETTNHDPQGARRPGKRERGGTSASKTKGVERVSHRRSK